MYSFLVHKILNNLLLINKFYKNRNLRLINLVLLLIKQNANNMLCMQMLDHFKFH